MSDIAVESVGGPVSVETDPVQSFSFENTRAQAMAMLDGTPAPQEQPDASAAEPDASVVTEESATNVDDASAAQLAQLSDDQLVEVTVDGEKVQLPWREARAGVMRQAHYTKSMQRLRDEQREFETQRGQFDQLQQQVSAVRTLLTDEKLLTQFLSQKFPHLLQQQQAIAQAQAAVDPNDIATVGQLQELQQQQAQSAAQLMQAFKQELQNELVQATTEMETRAATVKLAESVNSTIEGIFSEHPYLKELIPNAEDVLRYNVYKLDPQTPEETLQAFKDVATGWVETFRRQVEAQNKQAVITKQKLVKNNIQPPGGAQVQPQPTNFKKVNPMTGKTEVDWKALNAVAMNLLDRK